MRRAWALCTMVSLVGCGKGTLTEPGGGDVNGDGRVGFSDLHTPRSEAAYVPPDTRTPEDRLDDHLDRQKGGSEYERDRRDR